MGKTDINKYNSPDPRQPQEGSAGWAVTRKVLGFSLKAVASVLLVAVLTGIIVGVTMLMYVFSLRDTAVNIDLKQLQLNETSYVYAYDAEGNEKQIAQLHGVENREWVNLNRIPKNMQEAIKAIEDKRFDEHNGVDWRRTGFAVLNLFIKRSDNKQGGSTITQQLIKNLTGQNEVSIERKLREIFRALNLEKEYTKDEIIEAYLNVIPLGNGAYGVQAAAKTYFNKDVSELTLVECAAIAGITQNPSRYNPINNPQNNEERRKLVLSEMLEQGRITQEEYDEAIGQELELDTSNNGISSAIKVVDWYTDLVREDVIDDLMEKLEVSEKIATQMIYQNGLKIYSAVDLEMQEICENVYKSGKSMPKDPKLESGIVVMNYEGRILATVGRRQEKKANRLFSFATDALRQPGSSIKPLSVYSPAVEYNLLDWSTLVKDEPIELPDGSLYPRNSYSGYRGDITVQKALEISSNAAAVRVVQELGMKRSFDFLKDKFHISTVYESYTHNNGAVDTDISLSALATGGTITGVTAREMTAAFAAFGNGGKYYPSYSYYKVLDRDGNVLLDNTNQDYEQVISPATAGVMNKLLQAIVTGYEGTASYAKISGWELFGKTGTTNDFKDRWYLGGTPYCIAGIWCGYEQPKRIPGGHPAVPIWREIMVEYLKDKPKIPFEMPDSVVEREYCLESGGFATEYCPRDQVKKGWFKKDSVVQPCTVHTGQTEPEPESKEETSSSVPPVTSQSASSQTPSSSSESGGQSTDIPESSSRPTSMED